MLKRWYVWLLIVLGVILFAFGLLRFLVARISIEPERVVASGVENGRLAPCPETPNCVSSRDTDDLHGMEPIPFSGETAVAQAAMVELLQNTPNVTLSSVEPDYIQAEFRSPVWQFVDDVEFQFDANASVIHFRSASRLGYGDLNANRKRMAAIQAQFLQ